MGRLLPVRHQAQEPLQAGAGGTDHAPAEGFELVGEPVEVVNRIGHEV